ncbi:MAG: alpha/beta fold hydrolase [Candidatus Aminicenantales bacterium]
MVVKRESVQGSGFAPVRGGQLYFEVAGTGVPVVFVHGGLGDCRMWDSQWEPFARRFRVLRYDQRGFGRSSPPQRPFSPHLDLKAVCSYLGIPKAHVVGHSMGGGVSLDFALECPRRVAGLVLAGPSLHGHVYSDPFFQKGMELLAVAKMQGPRDAVRRLFADPFWQFTIPPPERRALRKRMEEMALGFFRAFYWDSRLIQPAEPPAALRLASLAAPTLVVEGEGDHPENLEVAERIKREMPRCLEVIIPGCGHMMPLENPRTFNTVVIDFLESLEGGPG